MSEPTAESSTQQAITDDNKMEERQKREDLMEPTELDQLLESANAKKLEANQQFAEGNYTKALEIYDEALELAPLKFEKERSIILSNCAAANIKLSEWDLAIQNATDSMDLGN
jgi:tetratricopeptide (TPR) repeat protein